MSIFVLEGWRVDGEGLGLGLDIEIDIVMIVRLDLIDFLIVTFGFYKELLGRYGVVDFRFKM